MTRFDKKNDTTIVMKRNENRNTAIAVTVITTLFLVLCLILLVFVTLDKNGNRKQDSIREATIWDRYERRRVDNDTLSSASGTPREVKTVRIGWYDRDRNLIGSSVDSDLSGYTDVDEYITDDLLDAKKSGYMYSYIQTIADYCCWDYEYVYGDWGELYDKLISGEIDLLPSIPVDRSVKGNFLFSDQAMNDEIYYLFKRKNDDSFSIDDPSSLNGRTVAVLERSRMEDVVTRWAHENDVVFDILYYEDYEQRESAFLDGSVDLIVNSERAYLSNRDVASVARIGEEEFYLGISNKREDLLDDLNYSLKIINDLDPYFMQKLLYDTYDNRNISNRLTKTELEWLNNHRIVKFGYMDDYLPFCGTDSEGRLYGLITDVISEISLELNIDSNWIETYAYTNYDEMLAALKEGEVDFVFPIGGEEWNIEDQGVNASNPVVTTRMLLVTDDVMNDESFSKIAINSNNRLQYMFVKCNYPNAKIYPCDSITACLEAVLNGEAESTIVNGLRSDLVLGNSRYNKLSLYQLPEADSRLFGVKIEDYPLLQILNRGLHLIGADYGFYASYKYMNDFYSATLMDYVRDHVVLVLFIVFSVAFVVTIVVVFYLNRLTKARNTVQIKLDEISELNVSIEKAKMLAEAANEAKTSFLFNISHDIRTPLNAIIGFTELAKTNVQDSETVSEYIDKIDMANGIMRSIIEDVLEMARIESGNVSSFKKCMRISSFDEALYLIFEADLKINKISLERRINVEHDYIVCDVTHIRQIVMNLVTNSIKYTPEGGKITVTLDELPCDRDGYSIFRTVVSDTGVGMSEDYLPIIFEQFSRERNATESQITGTGLGMAIVKRLVELMEGTIRVESIVGKGTNFIVDLPHRLATEEEISELMASESASKVKNADASLERRRVLLAEDNALSSEISQTLLSSAGLVVDVVSNGEECVRKIIEKTPGYYDIVLMDVQMPVLDGYEATKRIRKLKNKAKANIPIVALTANAFEEDRVNALKAGMNDHVAKPIVINELLEVIRKLLS